MNSKVLFGLLLILFALINTSCKKEVESVPCENIPKPRITLISPIIDTIFSNQREVKISIKSEVPAGISDLEFRLYRFGYNNDTVSLYYHREEGQGTTIQVEKIIKQGIIYNSKYWIKSTSRDTYGKRIDSNFFFWYGLPGVVMNLHHTQPRDTRFGVKMQFNKLYSLFLHINVFTYIKSISGTIKEKGTNKVLYRSELSDLSSWHRNNNPFVNVNFSINSNPTTGDTTFAYFEITGTDSHDFSNTFLTDCFIVD